MRKSQERIASILGLDKATMSRPTAGVGPMASGRFAGQNQSISQLLHSRREGNAGHPYKRDVIDRVSQERQPYHHTHSMGTDQSAGEG